MLVRRAAEREWPSWACYSLLSILAVPGVIYALFVLPIVIAQPRWN